MRKTSTNKAKGKKNRPKTKLGIPRLPIPILPLAQKPFKMRKVAC